jgi:hypothetical protein
MFSWGGQAVLESIRKSNYNTWKKRPTVSKFKQLKLLFRAKRAWKAAHRKK